MPPKDEGIFYEGTWLDPRVIKQCCLRTITFLAVAILIPIGACGLSGASDLISFKAGIACTVLGALSFVSLLNSYCKETKTEQRPLSRSSKEGLGYILKQMRAHDQRNKHSMAS